MGDVESSPVEGSEKAMESERSSSSSGGNESLKREEPGCGARDGGVALLEGAVSPLGGSGCEGEEEESVFELSSMSSMSWNVPPRTIPFRSASFSQVDITSEGKYVRNPRSPITLKPTAFCLNTPPSSTTLPRMAKQIRKTSSPSNNFLTRQTSSSLSSKASPQDVEKETRRSESEIVNVDEGICEESSTCDSATPTIEEESGLEPLLETESDTMLEPSSSERSKVRFQVGDPDYEPFGESSPPQQPFPGPIPVFEVEVGDEKSEEGGEPRRPPPIIREESLLGRSSSEEGAAPEPLAPPKPKSVRRIGLPNQKLSLLDMDVCGGSSVSGSGGEDDPDKFSLYRQSSGQSDASDELPHPSSDPGQEGALSDGCSSPPVLPIINPTSAPFAAALVLDSSLKRGGSGARSYSGAVTATMGDLCSGGRGLSSSSAPTSSSFGSSPPSGAKYSGRTTTPGSPTGGIPTPSEISRANSLSSAGRQLPPRRYYKRPLRGPYGEMLEAEMNKVISSRRNRELESLEFFRESKSSSPSRSPPNDPLLLGSSGSPKLSNALLMASMDDLNLTKQSKHPNPRCRKISTNLPVSSSSHYHCSGEEGGILTYHQRTASSPSQLLYTTTPDQHVTPHLDASPRGHVLAELLETEKSYVDSLRILVKKYMEPLKCSDFIDTGLVDEIFFQIPAVQWHHERLLDALQRRVTDDTQCVGDVLLDTFRQNSLLECYSLFVNNWKNAKGSLKMAVASKPPLARFLEANARQHKGKLSVDSLLIMPIQRIPRYELLLKELLKHTEPTHDDHSRLMLVLEKIKKFAVHIDCASVDPNDNREIEIEGWTAGLGHLVRQDVVALCTSSNVRKERALFLFADSIVIASIKRKSTMRKTSSNLGGSWVGSLEGCKFKLLMKVPLTDIHILNEEYDQCPSKSCSSGSNSSHSEDLDDLRTIHKMMDLASLLKCPHLSLDETLRDLASGLKHHCDTFADAVEFEIKTAEGSSENGEVLKVLFGSADKRTSWLDSFQDTLGKFIRYGFGKMPQMQFLQAVPIRKTRAGLLLSCAAPVSLQNKVSKNVEMSDVWVANSDGYVGQVCILTLHPEPAITSCNGVCNSRITCILSVPPPPAPLAPPQPPSAHPHSDNSSDSTTTSTHRHHHHHHHHSMGYESEDDSKNRAGGPKVVIEHWSVWLGTEDGALHVYDCSDSVRVKKNRHKVQHKAPLNCIVYFDSRVFISLGNGDVAVYSRNTQGKGWLVNEPSWVTIGSAMSPVTKMFCVGPAIWCACGSTVKVYGENAGSLELLQSISVEGGDDGCQSGISTLAAADDAVWIAVQGSSIIRSYSTTTYHCEFEADVAPPVASILAGCDDIIRQHKSACLRITALLVAPDKTLWIGTSAGVVLTLRSSGPDERKMASLCHGHTGQVRFLTHCTTRDSCVVISGGDGYEEFRQLNPILNNNNSATLSSVVSSLIGDSAVDLSGREDSTNHLLIWRVPKVGQPFQLP